MSDANHRALATSAGDPGLASAIDRTALGVEMDDPRRHIGPRASDGLDVLEKELLMLRKRCRARELALAHVAGAVTRLRRANRALNEENVLLRQQVAELSERASRKSIARRPGCGGSVASDG